MKVDKPKKKDNKKTNMHIVPYLLTQFIFFCFVILFCLLVLYLHICLCITFIPGARVPVEVRRDNGCPGTGLRDTCESTYQCYESNLGPLEKQSVL